MKKSKDKEDTINLVLNYSIEDLVSYQEEILDGIKKQRVKKADKENHDIYVLLNEDLLSVLKMVLNMERVDGNADKLLMFSNCNDIN